MAKYKGAMPKLPERGYFIKGDKGEEVKKLQRAINWANNGTIVDKLKFDGEVGSLTIAQVSFFEQIHHKTIDGEFGKVCLATLKALDLTGAIKACNWALSVAKDNRFSYGTGKRAHRCGCYYCQTNTGKRKKNKERAKERERERERAKALAEAEKAGRAERPERHRRREKQAGNEPEAEEEVRRAEAAERPEKPRRRGSGDMSEEGRRAETAERPEKSRRRRNDEHKENGRRKGNDEKPEEVRRVEEAGQPEDAGEGNAPAGEKRRRRRHRRRSNRREAGDGQDAGGNEARQDHAGAVKEPEA